MPCAVSLSSQLHATATCVPNATFGCASSDSLYVSGGCRGSFRCGPSQVDVGICGLRGKAVRVRCSCDADVTRRIALNAQWRDEADDAWQRARVERSMSAAQLVEAEIAGSHTVSSWWQREQRRTGGADPSLQPSYDGAGASDADADLPVADALARPTTCVAVTGVAHGYGAFFASAVARAWTTELQGDAPILRLPPWLPSPRNCSFLPRRPAAADAGAASSSQERLLTDRSSFLHAAGSACERGLWTCVAEPRRRCDSPGAALPAHWSPVWSERLGAPARPKRPLPGSPFWQLAEYTASVLRPNAEFERRLLLPILHPAPPPPPPPPAAAAAAAAAAGTASTAAGTALGAAAAPASVPLVPHAPCLAVHLRYGDSCSAREAYRTARRCSPVEEYVAHAKRLLRAHGFRSVVLASDSRRAADEFARRWGKRTPIIRSGGLSVEDGLENEGSVNWERHLDRLLPQQRPTHGSQQRAPRQQRGGMGREPAGDGARTEPTATPPTPSAEACAEWRGFLDFLADLYLMGSCDGLVAKFTSNLPRLSFALQVARRGRLPPYVSIDNSTWCSNSRTAKGQSRWGAFPC